ncbi:hypothetical protein ACQP06_12050 [Nocardia sp. CA-136227]|uniref:hypothetical protein n=1 Tax=Nocardia sp. CA-136227 TaxID=3239979 RepID=UPI003D9511B4
MAALDQIPDPVVTVESVLMFWLTRGDIVAMLGAARLRDMRTQVDALTRRFGGLAAAELTPDRLRAAYWLDPATDAADLAAGAERAVLQLAFAAAVESRLIAANPLLGPLAPPSAAYATPPDRDQFDGWATILSPFAPAPAQPRGVRFSSANAPRGGYLPPRGRLTAALARQ